jgi:hypothetical protein
MADTSPHTFFLHLPAGDRLYVCIVDEKRRAFDFTDNTFKVGSKLVHVRDACLPATGRREPRADHGYSYSVDIDLFRLLKGADPETIPADGAEVAVHWLRQIGDEPDVSADTRLGNTCALKNVGGRFEPASESDADLLDESRVFAQREKREAAYLDFRRRELDTRVALCDRLATAVRAGNVGGVLRVLADDICYWAGNLKDHLLHHLTHSAKDPLLVGMRMVPAPFEVHEDWAVRGWIGCHESYDLLEFHKSADFARSFAARLDRLHEARVEFSRNVIDYSAQTRGEDFEGLVALDEARKNLKHMALCLAEYLDVIAAQFEAASEAKVASAVQARFENREGGPPNSEGFNRGLQGQGDTDAPEKQGDPASADSTTPAPKRSTERGEGRAKLIPALTKHHQYADGGCLNLEPIGNNELAKAAGVSPSTASAFFNDKFKGHTKYKALCRDLGRLVAALKLLNDEFAPHHLYGRRPAGEDNRDG